MDKMKELLGNLRAKQDERTELSKKRKELRTKLEGHRDIDSAEYGQMRTEYYGFDDQMEAIDNEISQLRTDIADKKIEDALRKKPTAESASDDERQEVLKSGKYRDAFFRSVSSGRVLEKDKEVMAFGKRAITDMNGDGVDSGAEYVIPLTSYNMILSVIREYGQVYNAISKTGFTGDIAIPIGSLHSKTENEDGTFSLKFTFTEAKISQEAIVGTIVVKNLLLKNSISAFEGFIVEQLGKQIALLGDNGIVNGDGGSFKGILEKLTPKTYTALSYDTIIDAEHSLSRAYSKTAGWVMNWTTFGSFRKIKDTNNNPVGKIDVVVKLNGMDYPTINNKPVLIVDEIIMGDGDFLYGNLASYRVNESQSMIIESDASPEFKSDKTVYRGKLYSGGVPVLPEENFSFYVISTDVVATPTADPVAGEVAADTSVILATTTTGATIYYTLDGTTPTKSSTKYSASNKPKITEAATLKAIAVKIGKANSAVLSAAYTIAE